MARGASLCAGGPKRTGYAGRHAEVGAPDLLHHQDVRRGSAVLESATARRGLAGSLARPRDAGSAGPRAWHPSRQPGSFYSERRCTRAAKLVLPRPDCSIPSHPRASVLGTGRSHEPRGGSLSCRRGRPTLRPETQGPRVLEDRPEVAARSGSICSQAAGPDPDTGMAFHPITDIAA
jgi:hypothetical protein